MIILDNTVSRIEVLLANAVTSTQWDLFCSYTDQMSSPYGYARRAATTNNTTAVNVSGFLLKEFAKRLIEFMSITNADTAANRITVRFNDGTTTTKIYSCTLAPGSTLFYEDKKGFYALDQFGAPIVTTSDTEFAVTLTNSGANAFVGTIAGLTGYADMMGIKMRFSTAVDGPATVNINGFGALNLVVYGTDALSGPSTGATNDDIKAGQIVVGIVDLPNSKIQIQTVTDNIINNVP